jgi:hypothetical protein
MINLSHDTSTQQAYHTSTSKTARTCPVSLCSVSATHCDCDEGRMINEPIAPCSACTSMSSSIHKSSTSTRSHTHHTCATMSAATVRDDAMIKSARPCDTHAHARTHARTHLVTSCMRTATPFQRKTHLIAQFIEQRAAQLRRDSTLTTITHNKP